MTSYHFIETMIRHYREQLQTAGSFKKKVFLKQGLRHWEMKRLEYLN